MSERRWGFMSRFTLVNQQGEVYLQRLRIIKTPWVSLFLHRLDVPDPGVDLHDHPWPFLSLILRGGYIEHVAPTRLASAWAREADRVGMDSRGLDRRWRAGSIHYMPLSNCHRIVTLFRVPTWTLILTGPKRQSWGFYQPEGYVDHEDYDFKVRRYLGAQGEAVSASQPT